MKSVFELTDADLPAFGEISESFEIRGERYFLLGNRGDRWGVKAGHLAEQPAEILRHGDGFAIAVYAKDVVEPGPDWRELLEKYL